MQGIQIFIHSVRQVFGNLSNTLRISGLLTLVQFGLTFLLGIHLLRSPAGNQAMMMQGTFPYGKFALFMLLSGIIGMWIAVAWHRYVLLQETPTSVIPPLNGSRIWAYFVTGVLIMLIELVVTIIVSALLGAFVGFGKASMGMALPSGGVVGGIAGAVIASYIFFRLGPALPAAALGRPLGLTEAWRHMAGKSGVIAVLAIITALLWIGLSLVPALIFGPDSVSAIVIGLIAKWISVMVGISIMTTLYGHYVEGRAIV